MPTPYGKNAKKHPDKQLKQIADSLRRFGWRQPIVVDKNDEIIVGHGRWMAYKKYPEGIKEPWIEKANDLSPEEVKAYRLADNKLNESEWDMGLAIEELKELSPELFDLTGFDKDLLIEPDEKDDVIPEDVPPVAKLGDIWQLGRHKVMCGDSTQPEAVLRLMGDNRSDMVFTSPPYNAGKSESLSGNTHTTDNKYQDGYDDDQTQEGWAELIKKSLDAIIPYSQYQFYNIQMLAGNKRAFLHLLGDYAEQVVDIAVWNKGHGAPAMAKNVMNSAYEFIVIFSSESNPNRSIKIGNFRGTLRNVFDIPPQRGNEFSKVHAATFPVALPTEVIKGMTNREAIIVDNFLGVGSTLIACEKTGRICYGMELDPKYVDVIIKRWEDYTGNKAEKVV